jgi:hypothetical protein
MPQSAGLHEDAKLLRPETIDRHRAIASLGEELEAIDWYDQRVDATGDQRKDPSSAARRRSRPAAGTTRRARATARSASAASSDSARRHA